MTSPRDAASSCSIEAFVRTFLDDAARAREERARAPQRPVIASAEISSGAARKVFARTKDLAMQVLSDRAQVYSVSGYNDRARQLFGEIYLGLDKGDEYDRQAGKVNAAIRALSVTEAFDIALGAVRDKLAAEPAASDGDVIVAMLARACTRWFDLPDGSRVVEGGPRAEAPAPPARCPADYAVPSACMFYSDGDRLIGDGSRAIGAILRAAHLDYVKHLKTQSRAPVGPLSRAVFDAFPDSEDDLRARTIIGVMMGMLPTTYFNLSFVLEAWRSGGGARFAELQHELSRQRGNNPCERAYAVLRQPMFSAMQARPMPPEVWRTATRDHALGDLTVTAGDKVVVDIATVTASDLERGKSDVFAIFGGDSGAQSPPTHACPGYEAAIALMLGTLTGLLEGRAAA